MLNGIIVCKSISYKVFFVNIALRKMTVLLYAYINIAVINLANRIY